MGASASRMTVEDYYAITVLHDRKELVDGMIVVNEPKLVHLEIQGTIHAALREWTKGASGRGRAYLPTDVRLDEHNLFAPDVLWIAERHVPADFDCYPERVPDICVEVRSPGTWRRDTGPKKDAYERHGLLELWLVDTKGLRVLVFRRSRPDAPTFDIALELMAGDELTSPQLPGFALPLDELFEL